MQYNKINSYRLQFRFNNTNGNPFNTPDMLDMPGNMFFQVFFHFQNGTSSKYIDNGDIGYSTGLLGLPQLSKIETIQVMNDKEFENYLNNISWYDRAMYTYYENKMLNSDVGYYELTDEEALHYEELSKKINKPQYEDIEHKLPRISNKTSADYTANFNKYRERLYEETNAWTYLVMNGEDERALLLLDFIALLYNISYEEPWYFLKITGLDAAIERKQVMEHDFKFDEQRNKITITCLPDAVDNRIGTLLDMYRSIVFSWLNKVAILPANLRKFDMSIYIYQSPLFEFGDSLTNLNSNCFGIYKPKSAALMSYKYFELHNCEIDYSSCKSGYGELNNAEGFNQEYQIDILFDDIYESRYNQWIGDDMGDLLKNDLISALYELGSAEEKRMIELGKINDDILDYIGACARRSKINEDDSPEEKLKKMALLLVEKKNNFKKLLEEKTKKTLKDLKKVAIMLGIKLITGLINKISLGNLFEYSPFRRNPSLTALLPTANDLLGIAKDADKEQKSRLGRELTGSIFDVGNKNAGRKGLNDIIKDALKDNFLAVIGLTSDSVQGKIMNIFNKNASINLSEGEISESLDDEIDTDLPININDLGNLYTMKSIKNNI